MGKCISKCFIIYQNKKSINSQLTIKTQTSARLELQQINIQNEVREYFPSYQGTKSIQWKDIMYILKKLICKYKDTKNKLSNEYLIELMQRYEKFYFRKNDIVELLNIVIQIVKKSDINYSKKQENHKFNQCQEQMLRIGQKLNILEQSLVKNHKASIQQLKFLCQHQKKQHQNYHKQHCHTLYWNDLKFDMSQKQIQTVVITIRALTQNDIKAFAFLTLYFQIALQNKGRQVKTKKLQEIYNEHIQKLKQKYSAKDVLLLDSLQPKPKLKQVTNNQVESIQCKFLTNSSYHYDQLRQFLLQKCIQSKKDQSTLMQLIRESFIHNKLCRVEFQQRKISQQQSLNLFNQNLIKLLQKQTIFNDKFQKLKQSITENVKKLQKTTNLTIHQLTKFQNQQIDTFLKDILQKQQKISIIMDDMIKVKYFFTQIDSIIQATNKFVQNIDKNGLKLVSLENRLNLIQKDIKLTVKLDNSIVSIFMKLELQSISNQFNLKLRNLVNNQNIKIYSPLTHLSRLNKFNSNEFFIQLFERYHHMSDNFTSNNAQQIAQLTAQIDSFKIKYLKPYHIHTEINSHQNFQNLTEIITLLKQLKNILKLEALKNKHFNKTENHQVQQKINQILLSNKIKDFQKTKQLISKIKKQQLQSNQILLQVLGDIYKEQKYFNQSLSYYLKSKKVYLQKNSTQAESFIRLLQKIALIYQCKQSYKESLQTLQHSLLIKQKIYQPDSIQCASTLFLIGQLYQKHQRFQDSNKFYKLSLTIHSQSFNQNSLESAKILQSLADVSQIRKRHDKAIKWYEKCLKLYQIFHGSQSQESAQILHKMGASYLFKAQYEKSFECYFKSLQIKQRIKGRNSKYCASTLSGIGSVYEKKDEYESAIKYYKHSLQVIEKFEGKDSLECVKYLNKMIVVFYHEQKYEQALAYGLRCLQIQQKEKGKESIDCSGTLFGLSLAYQKLGMRHEAYAVCRRAYRIRQKALGDEHSLTQQAFNRGQYLIERQNQNCLRDVFTF